MSLIIGASFTAGCLLASLRSRARFESLEAELRGELESELARLDERLEGREERLSELNQLLAQRELTHERSYEEIRALEAQVAELATRLEDERRSSAEKLSVIETAKTSLTDAFKAMSADALRSNNQSFLELALQNLSRFQEGAKGEMEKREQAIGELVRPLRESLERVDEKIDLLESSRTAAYVSLHEQVKVLAETQIVLRNETGNLVKALRAPAVRGRWGEIQLRRVVELAGMQAHCDFFEQESTDTEEGRRRPDMVIRLPNGREIAVDAKVPIEAYLRAVEAQNEEEKLFHLRDHARQLRDHINKLGQKSYYQHFESPEFTVLFLSGETFYSAALEHDPSLIEFGMERKVIIATPPTLIGLLKTVYYGWRQEALADHLRVIRKLGTDLHDRLRVMTEHINKMRKGIDQAVGGYNDFISSFDNRVLVSARKFKELDIVESKEIAAVERVETSTLVSKLELIGKEAPLGDSTSDLAVHPIIGAASTGDLPEADFPKAALPPAADEVR